MMYAYTKTQSISICVIALFCHIYWELNCFCTKHEGCNDYIDNKNVTHYMPLCTNSAVVSAERRATHCLHPVKETWRTYYFFSIKDLEIIS